VSVTVTFLFTDIDGSTQLWEEEPERMQAALAGHDALVHLALRAGLTGHFATAVRVAGHSDSKFAAKKMTRQPNEARARSASAKGGLGRHSALLSASERGRPPAPRTTACYCVAASPPMIRMISVSCALIGRFMREPVGNWRRNHLL